MIIRTLLAAGAMVGLAGAAHAQGFVPYESFNATYDSSSGLTVYGQPRDAYVIRLDTRGKDLPTIHREITFASYEACRNAPRTGNVLEMRPTAISMCVGAARTDAHRQLASLQTQRMRGGYLYTSSYNYGPVYD